MALMGCTVVVAAVVAAVAVLAVLAELGRRFCKDLLQQVELSHLVRHLIQIVQQASI